MAYISLYRKYRSQTFDDVIGQDHVVRTITNAIKAGRIGQGYLFCGSRGTGKTTVARLIAKALNCQSTDGPTADFCNVCEACVSITEGHAVDVVEMDAASNRSVVDVDALRDGVTYSPMRLRYKVYIIDEAHQLSAQAKDAFLKTLEEPPPHAVFILATTEAQKIPITIRSRCQQFDFRRGTSEEIAERLSYVAKSEEMKIDEEAIELIARAAQGSYRDGLSVLEQVMAYTDERVTARDVYTVLGMVDEDVMLELGDVIRSGDAGAAFEMAERLMREGRDVRELLKSAASHFRDVLALKVGADARRKDDERWKAQADQFSQMELVRTIDVFSAAEKELRFNEQHRLGLEMAILKAMGGPKEAAPVPTESYAVRPRPQPQVETPTVKPEPVTEPTPVPEQAPEPAPVEAAVEAEPEPAPEPTPVEPAPEPESELLPVEPAPEPEPEPAPTPAAESPLSVGGGQGEVETAAVGVTLAQIQGEWQSILKQLQVGKQGGIASLLRPGKPVDLQGSVLTIGFGRGANDFTLGMIERGSENVADVVEKRLNVRLKIKAVRVDGPGLDRAPAGKPKQAEPEQHPLLDDVLTKFDGTIVDDDDKSPWEE